jgi:thiamine-phosphate pyrophosphorylase
MLAAGVRLLQWRDKQASARSCWINPALSPKLSARSGALFFVNDRPDVAYLAGAERGARRPARFALRSKRARCLVPKTFVGVSTHNLEQFTDAAATSADYIAIGPIFETRTKANPDPVVGAELVRRARALTDKPIVAIGGITLERSAEIIAAGADSVAVISDILLAPDPAERAAKFIVHLDGLPQRNDPNKSPSSPATDADVRLS